MNHWLVISRETKRRSRARIKEGHIKTTICYNPDASHTLHGEHGRRILTAVAEAWNRQGYVTSNNFTRCRADFSTEAARKTFTLSIS